MNLRQRRAKAVIRTSEGGDCARSGPIAKADCLPETWLKTSILSGLPGS